ncbi:MAG: 50S ribosomal protein L4 [Deltaproteobacteria bacterium]|nr:50S ribosomal protein L4 [Deltaproteobacteria bacterium]
MAIDVFNTEGNKVSEIEISFELFPGKVKETLFHETVRMHLANLRSGTASTKNRAEVSGSGRKPWKQKGTGRARSGSIRSPIWRHGGVVFGPRPRDYSYSMPGSAMKSALKAAIQYKINEGKLRLFDRLVLPLPKAHLALDVFKKAAIGSALVVIDAVDGEDKNLRLAAGNLKDFKILDFKAINVYDILRYDALVMTRGAFEKVTARLQ